MRIFQHRFNNHELMKPILNLLLFLFLFNGLSAQELINGELLVKLKEDVDKELFFENLILNRNLNAADLKFKSISAPLHLHKISIDQTRINQDQLLDYLIALDAVEKAGVNFKLELREVTPDDNLYPTQWDMEAIGAPDVWECTTGGVTASGDTIVIANLEDCDAFHVDLVDNLWTNNQEIPNNGIDDDGNGYVDDYYGVSIEFGGDNHPGDNQHGTKTSGILAAKGNNAIGVTGVNWDVKLMVVSNNLQFDQIVEGYQYVLDMRKAYNDSNGQEGAFVVTTNASFGTPGAVDSNPWFDDWCMMYELLGQEGVLNAGATTNSKINIDEVGDMPTSCPSDYMVAVTDIDQSSRLQGGYSETQIDLGAPGSDVPALDNFDTYSQLSGTSSASPHVAGAIALLYSLPCDTFNSFYKSDPAAAALLIKDALLNGATASPIEDLDGKSVTGGMLNIKNSMEYIQEYCGSKTGALAILEISPNPASEYITVKYQIPENSPYTLKISNSIGQLVFEKELIPEKFESNEIAIQVGGWLSGYYTLSIENINNITSKPFLVIQ